MSKIKLFLCVVFSFSLLGCMSKRDSAKNGSAFFTPPHWVIDEPKVDTFPTLHWSESYELKEKNGNYTMVYTQSNEKESSQVFPVTITGVPIPQTTDEEGQPIEDEVHFKYGFETTLDEWVITLTNPTDKPISENRPNGDYWKINKSGMLEVWNCDGLVEVIPGSMHRLVGSLLSFYIVDQLTTFANKNDGKLHLLQDGTFYFECAEGHRWEADLVATNNYMATNNYTWCQECEDNLIVE